MYYAKHTQSGYPVANYLTVQEVIEKIHDLGWEDIEWELWESSNGAHSKMEFPCTYTFHYGEEHYTCELTANRPDSLCPFHAGDED